MPLVAVDYKTRQIWKSYEHQEVSAIGLGYMSTFQIRNLPKAVGR